MPLIYVLELCATHAIYICGYNRGPPQNFASYSCGV